MTKSLLGVLFAALALCAGPAQATTAFKLSGSSDGTGVISVDEDLDVYLNGTQIYTDGVAVAGDRNPISVNASPGDTLRFVVRDTYGDCQGLSTIWLTDPATGRNVAADIGFDNGCGFPATNNGIVHDFTFTIPPFSAQPGDLLILANEAGGFDSFSIIATTDFTTGVELATFVPSGAQGILPNAPNGRAVAISGNEVFYTVLAAPFGPTDAIRVAPFNGGAGGADTRSIPNPRPGCGIADLDFDSGGALWALTGYRGPFDLVTCAPREVFKLDPSNGNVLAGPIVIGGGTDADGFVVLPNGNFLINTHDASCFYDEFNGTTGAFTGNLIHVPGPSADLTPTFCTGVVTDGTSLYFVAATEFEPFNTVTKTTLAGVFISRVVVDDNEDIALTFAAGGGGNSLTDVSPAHLFVGLKNGDDIGTQFDLKVELLQNGTVVASGLQRCVTGLLRDPTKAKEAVVPFDPLASPVALASGDVLSLRVSTRVGTTPTGAKCAGPGGSHASSDGLRLYYDGNPFVLSGSPDGKANITVDDDLDVYVNGVLILSTHSTAGHPVSPAPIPITARPGDTLRFVVRDTFGLCSNLSPLYLTDTTGHSVLADPGFVIACDPSRVGNQGVTHDHSFTIPNFAFPPANGASRFDMTIAPGASADVYLHSDGSACPNGGTGSTGVTNRFLDNSVPGIGKPKCKDSGTVNFAGSNPFSVIGTWSMAPLP